MPLDMPRINVIERILCHLVEAREAAIGAGLPATTEAIERTIVVAAVDGRPRRATACLNVINGLKSP